METLVVYYSQKGSNKYLANKIAHNLNCKIIQLKPIPNWHLFLIFGLTLGNRGVNIKIENFDRIILCGPIWMGKFIAPLKAFVRKYNKKIRKLIFVTCCGSTFEKKMERFGHGLVFKEVENMLKEKCVMCEAFPIELVLPDDKKNDTDTFLKTHLSDKNFNGEIQELFDRFMQKI